MKMSPKTGRDEDKHTEHNEHKAESYERPTNSIEEINGPSGIIVDNDASTASFAQASSLYFSNQGNSTAGVPCNAITGVGCAVKVTQAGLN